MFANLNLLLHKDLRHPSSLSKSGREPCLTRTTEPVNPTKYIALQKDSVQCIVAAVDIGYLLFTVWYSRCFVVSKWTFFYRLHCYGVYCGFSFLKLVIKPDSLLLEDQRSEAGS